MYLNEDNVYLTVEMVSDMISTVFIKSSFIKLI